MYRDRKKSRILIFTTLLILVTSCAVLKINPPSPSVQTILVLPVKITIAASSPRYGFSYGYEIVNVLDSSATYEAIFKLPNEKGILLVDSLPPGNYFVSKFSIIPISGAGAVSRKNYRDRYDKFKLVSGKITIFQNSLKVSVERDPNFIETTRYYSDIEPVSQSQKDEILATLKKLENYNKWEVLGMDEVVQEPKGFKVYQTKNLNDFRAFATDMSSGRWGRSRFSATPKQAVDRAMSFCERTGRKCTIYALGDTIVSGMSPAELLAAAEKYYFSVSPAMAKMNESRLRGSRLSSKEIAAHLSDASVIGTNDNFMKYKGTWQSNGVMKAEAVRLGRIERAPSDVGTWTVEDGKLCRQWKNWLGGRLECLIVTKEGNTLRAYDNHGNAIEVIDLIDQY